MDYASQEETDRIYEEQQKEYLEYWAKQDEERKKWKIEDEKRKEKELRKKTTEFYKAYPKFLMMDIDWNTSRSELISLLYDLKYNKSFESKRDFDSFMKPNIKDKLFGYLHDALIENECTGNTD